VIGRRNPGLDQESARGAVTFVTVAGASQRRAVGHVGNGVGFDEGLALFVPPDRARVAVDVRRRHRRRRQAMYVEPLLDEFVGVARIDRAVGASMPHRQFRPRALVLRCLAHEIAKFMRGARRRLHHPVERLPHVAGNSEWKTGNDRAARKHFRIGRQHHRRHGATGGQTGDIDAARIDLMLGDDPGDHLADGSRLALAARNIAGTEPVETGIGVVRRLLFGHQQGKPVSLRERRPSGAEIVPRRGLATAMQHNDQGRRGLEMPRHESEHPQRAGIGAEFVNFDQRTCNGRSRALPIGSQAVETAQLRKLSHEFDILGEGQVATPKAVTALATRLKADSCCTAK